MNKRKFNKNMLNKKHFFSQMIKYGVRIILAILIASFVVSYCARRVSKISTSIVERRSSSFALEKRSEMTVRLEKDFKEIGNADAKIEQAFPSEDTIFDFVASMESLGIQASRKQNLSFATVYGGATFDYNISLDGNIETFIGYLNLFEKLPYFISLQGITFNSPAGGWLENSSVSMKASALMR